MPEPMDDLDVRLDRALHAMQDTAPVPRDAADRVAARAILAGSPAARTSTWALRAAALLAVAAVGATVGQRLRGTDAAAELPPAALVASRDMAARAAAAVLPVAATAARPIIFELDAPAAHSVQVLGDFNHWSRDATAMQRGADGHWRITTLLPPGRYIYAYLVDGRASSVTRRAMRSRIATSA